MAVTKTYKRCRSENDEEGELNSQQILAASKSLSWLFSEEESNRGSIFILLDFLPSIITRQRARILVFLRERERISLRLVESPGKCGREVKPDLFVKKVGMTT